jgi:hypothetical protein
MKKIISLSLTVIITSTLVGCGGDDSSESINTGTFVDAPVQGLQYSTTTQSGVTDENGNFKYKDGETVTFQIGNLVLGSVAAKKTITPITLGGDTNLNMIGTKSTNIARILQSLDDNSSNSSIIVIPTALQDLNVTNNIDLESESDLNTILTKAQSKTSKTYTLRDASDAKDEMKEFLQGYLYNGSYSGTSSFDPEQSSESALKCGNDITWNVTISGGTTVSGSTSVETLTVSGITLSNSTMEGTLSDGTIWNSTIDENGDINGTYNFGNDQCVGTIAGTKN